jgi:hypothetical protein
MLGRGLRLVSLLLGLLLALTSCGPRALSPQAYQDLVIKALQGAALEKDLLPLPGLIPSIKRVFDSLYCPQYECVFPSEMEYAAMMADRGLGEIAAYRARICGNKGLRPPRELRSTHEQLCKGLDRIRADTDAIKITAQMAAQVLTQAKGEPEALERAARSYSAKIMERKGAIIEALRELREIEWLGPVFTGVESQIPELGTEME